MKIKLAAVSGLVTSVLYSTPVLADAGSLCPSGAFAWLCTGTAGGGQGLGKVVGAGVQLTFILATVLALGYLIYGGIRWITSGGDKTAVEGARNHIIAAIIGLAVIFLSFLILNVVVGFFVPGFKLDNIILPELKN